LDLASRIPHFLSELERTGVTRLLLWEEYRKECNDPYRYTQFCILLKEASKLLFCTVIKKVNFFLFFYTVHVVCCFAI